LASNGLDLQLETPRMLTAIVARTISITSAYVSYSSQEYHCKYCKLWTNRESCSMCECTCCQRDFGARALRHIACTNMLIEETWAMMSARGHGGFKTVILIFSFSELPVSSNATTKTSCNADSCSAYLTSNGPHASPHEMRCNIQNTRQKRNKDFSFTASMTS
jgi:hypothetical protein